MQMMTITHSSVRQLKQLLAPAIFLSIATCSCTKHIIQEPDTSTRTSITSSKAKNTGNTLHTTSYPNEPAPWGPVLNTPASFPFYTGNTPLENGMLSIINDPVAIYISVWNLSWQAGTENLKLWIGLPESNLPALQIGQMQQIAFPVKYPVQPGTACYCVEIQFADLADYFQQPITCNSDFKLVVQANVAANGKNQKAWAGDAVGGKGNNSFRWVSNFDAACTEMPPPPGGN